jgi:hypothetical protein
MATTKDDNQFIKVAILPPTSFTLTGRIYSEGGKELAASLIK